MKKEQTTNLPALEKSSKNFNEQAIALKIETPEDMKKATEMLSQLNKASDSVTKEKELITKPLNEALKEVRGRYKPIENALDEAIASIRRKMSGYQTEQVRLQEAEAQKIASRVGSGKGKIKIETAVKQIESIETVDKKTVTGNGSVSFKAEKMFEVMDASKLPNAYILPNLPAIRQAMKEGFELPGVRYYVEQVPINRRA